MWDIEMDLSAVERQDVGSITIDCKSRDNSWYLDGGLNDTPTRSLPPSPESHRPAEKNGCLLPVALPVGILHATSMQTNAHQTNTSNYFDDFATKSTNDRLATNNLILDQTQVETHKSEMGEESNKSHTIQEKDTYAHQGVLSDRYEQDEFPTQSCISSPTTSEIINDLDASRFVEYGDTLFVDELESVSPAAYPAVDESDCQCFEEDAPYNEFESGLRDWPITTGPGADLYDTEMHYVTMLDGEPPSEIFSNDQLSFGNDIECDTVHEMFHGSPTSCIIQYDSFSFPEDGSDIQDDQDEDDLVTPTPFLQGRALLMGFELKSQHKKREPVEERGEGTEFSVGLNLRNHWHPIKF